MTFFLWAIFGGFCVELVALYKIRTNLEKIPNVCHPFYFLTGFLMCLSGGFLVLLHQSDDGVVLSELMAFNIGASAPALLGTVMKEKFDI